MKKINPNIVDKITLPWKGEMTRKTSKRVIPGEVEEDLVKITVILEMDGVEEVEVGILIREEGVVHKEVIGKIMTERKRDIVIKKKTLVKRKRTPLMIRKRIILVKRDLTVRKKSGRIEMNEIVNQRNLTQFSMAKAMTKDLRGKEKNWTNMKGACLVKSRVLETSFKGIRLNHNRGIQTNLKSRTPTSQITKNNQHPTKIIGIRMDTMITEIREVMIKTLASGMGIGGRGLG